MKIRLRLCSSSVVLCIAGASPSYACPDLSGLFECQAFLSNPARTLSISTTFHPDRSAIYRFEYVTKSGEKTVQEYEASDQGVPAPDGKVRICSGDSFIVRPRDKSDAGTINFINAHNDYQFKFGTMNITCPRRPK